MTPLRYRDYAFYKLLVKIRRKMRQIGLFEHIDGASFKRGVTHSGRIFRRENHYRRRLFLHYALRRLYAVHNRHVYVHRDDIRLKKSVLLYGASSIVCLAHNLYARVFGKGAF